MFLKNKNQNARVNRGVGAALEKHDKAVNNEYNKSI